MFHAWLTRVQIFLKKIALHVTFGLDILKNVNFYTLLDFYTLVDNLNPICVCNLNLYLYLFSSLCVSLSHVLSLSHTHTSISIFQNLLKSFYSFRNWVNKTKKFSWVSIWGNFQVSFRFCLISVGPNSEQFLEFENEIFIWTSQNSNSFLQQLVDVDYLLIDFCLFFFYH